MSKMSQHIAESSLRQQHKDEEPQDYERFAMTPEQEEEFENWAKRLVPCIGKGDIFDDKRDDDRFDLEYELGKAEHNQER